MSKKSLADSLLSSIDDGDEPSPKRSKFKPKPKPVPAYTPPSHDEQAVDAAHRAHRDTLEGWIRGDVSDAKMRKASARLKKATKGRGY